MAWMVLFSDHMLVVLISIPTQRGWSSAWDCLRNTCRFRRYVLAATLVRSASDLARARYARFSYLLTQRCTTFTMTGSSRLGKTFAANFR